jgi:hypothetical protein
MKKNALKSVRGDSYLTTARLGKARRISPLGHRLRSIAQNIMDRDGARREAVAAAALVEFSSGRLREHFSDPGYYVDGYKEGLIAVAEFCDKALLDISYPGIITIDMSEFGFESLSMIPQESGWVIPMGRMQTFATVKDFFEDFEEKMDDCPGGITEEDHMRSVLAGYDLVFHSATEGVRQLIGLKKYVLGIYADEIQNVADSI